MFKSIVKKLKYQFVKNNIESNTSEEQTYELKPELSKHLEENVRSISEYMGNSSDVIVRDICISGKRDMNAALIFIDGMVNVSIINKHIIEPLNSSDNRELFSDRVTKDDLVILKTRVLSASQVTQASNLKSLLDGILSGSAALFIDNSSEALIIDCKGWEKRAITEPVTDVVVRGPREGFTENLRTNTALLRRKIKNSDLTIENMVLGQRTRTTVCLAFIRGIANTDVLKEVRKRIKRINSDAILESGYIEQFIEDAPFSIFSTIAYTEKPDAVAAKLLEGRIAVFIDGTPFVLTVPMLFIESFQSSEDYYSRPYFMSMLRLVRFLSFLVTTLSPAFYVAITTFHQELIPDDLLFTMAAAREGIPFPAAIEAGIMIFAFEVLREAGLRLPRPMGQAISIVGALVMGEAAVSAGLIGAPMVIVIAITSVAIFVVPNQSDAAAILRVAYLILAATFGGVGVTIGLLATLVHLSSLKSFGAYYLSPVLPFIGEDMKDSFIRFPIWYMKKRPKSLFSKDETRTSDSVPASAVSDKVKKKN